MSRRNVNFVLDDSIKAELERVAKESGLPMSSIVIAGINEQVAAHDRRKMLSNIRRLDPTKQCWYCQEPLNQVGGECVNPVCDYAAHKREEQAAINRAEFAAASGL